MLDTFDTMTKKRWVTVGLNFVSGGALIIASAWFVNNLLASRDAELPPRVVSSITVEPTILLAGKPFVAHIHVTINKQCPYEVHWSLVRLADNVEVVKIIEPIKQPTGVMGPQELPPLTRYVPSTVAPGEYKYASEVLDLCPDGHTYTSVRKNADVIVR